MARTICNALILLLLASAAGAETFRCTDAAGKVTFTDDPAGLRGCQPLTVQTPPSGPMSRHDTQSAPGGRDAESHPAGNAVPAPQPGAAEDEFTLFLNEATALVEEYKVSKRTAHYANLRKDQLAARKNLADIRQRKQRLLDEVVAARLLAADEQAIRQTLAAIPDQE